MAKVILKPMAGPDSPIYQRGIHVGPLHGVINETKNDGPKSRFRKESSPSLFMTWLIQTIVLVVVTMV
jgi:hypothetical protein